MRRTWKYVNPAFLAASKNLLDQRSRTPPDPHHVPLGKTLHVNYHSKRGNGTRIPEGSFFMINLLDENSFDIVAESAGARIHYIRISERGYHRSIHNCTARQIDHRHNNTLIPLTFCLRMPNLSPSRNMELSHPTSPPSC